MFLRELEASEKTWTARDVKYPREDAVHWMPFAIPQYVALLTEAMEAAPFSRPMRDMAMADFDGTWTKGALRMIDVGCGPGTKLRLARELFGLNVYGIDIVQRFVDECLYYNIRAVNRDAFEVPETGGSFAWGYADFDIVYVNRPSGLQDELEGLVMERMRSDAVLMAVNWRNDPGKHGFTLHYQEYGEPVCGVWIKQ